MFTKQPGAPAPPPPPGAPVQWMESMPTMENCPPGLEYLTAIDRIVVKQERSLFEAMTEWEVKNKYSIYNGAGQQAYFAYEESSCCQRQCCGSNRGYTLHVVDNFQREVMRITRPFKCCVCGCCACWNSCGTQTFVESPPGSQIAVVQQRFGCCSNNFEIGFNDMKSIRGPNMCSCNYCCNCCGDKVFKVKTMDDEPIGDIRKKWTGFTQEYFTDADTFTVDCEFLYSTDSASVPQDLDVKLKAGLIAATFLVDFVAFEDNQGNKDC